MGNLYTHNTSSEPYGVLKLFANCNTKKISIVASYSWVDDLRWIVINFEQLNDSQKAKFLCPGGVSFAARALWIASATKTNFKNVKLRGFFCIDISNSNSLRALISTHYRGVGKKRQRATTILRSCLSRVQTWWKYKAIKASQINATEITQWVHLY